MRYALGAPHHFSPLFDFFAVSGFWAATTFAGAYLFRMMSA
jgi:hypothetical protein